MAYNNLQGLARRVSLRGEFAIEPQNATPSEYLGNLGFREPRLDDTSGPSGPTCWRSARRV